MVKGLELNNLVTESIIEKLPRLRIVSTILSYAQMVGDAHYPPKVSPSGWALQDTDIHMNSVL